MLLVLSFWQLCCSRGSEKKKKKKNLWLMEYSERVLCGTGEVEPDPDIVSEEAGKLYSELQVRMRTICYVDLGGNIIYMWSQIPVFSLCCSLLFASLFTLSQTVIEIHGESVVESLVPIFVWVLEGLASCKAQLRDREEEAEREKAEREELLERYHAEKTLRKESQEVSHDTVKVCCCRFYCKSRPFPVHFFFFS